MCMSKERLVLPSFDVPRFELLPILEKERIKTPTRRALDAREKGTCLALSAGGKVLLAAAVTAATCMN